MLRRLGLLVPALALIVVVPVPARAATKTVVVADMSFSPSSATVVVGDTVKWSFQETHTTTSDQGFWDSGNKSAGQTFSRTFTDAGTYPYHCTIHAMMHGKVQLKVKSAGTASQGYALRWSSRTSTPAGVTFDIQVKKFGTSSWVAWRTGTTTRTGTFNPAGAHSYYLRARTHVGGNVSSYSPNITLKIT